MKILNLTPHLLTLVGYEGILTVAPSGQIARLDVTRKALPSVKIDGRKALPSVKIDGVTLQVNRIIFGEITGLPDKQDGVILVVSALVAEAAKRSDVFSPDELIRDESGAVIGARGLCAYAGGDL